MIDVIWYNGAKGNWDSGLLASIFDGHPAHFRQHNTKAQVFFEKAIVIIVGNPEPTQVFNYLSKIKHGLAILTSDEVGEFDYKKAIPPHFEVWTQYYHAGKSDIETRLLVGAPSRIKDYDTSPLPKEYLWSFVGQVQHEQREKCVSVLRTLPDGYLHISKGFGGQENGMEYQPYLDVMRKSKFVICPAGNVCADSFRVYEAIACGAIPIVERRAPRDAEGFDYWGEVWQPNGLVAVNEWGALPSILRNTEQYTEVMDGNGWYDFYKEVLTQQLIDYAG